jgi:hypothetical protein
MSKQTAVEWFQEQIIKIVNGTCELSEIQIFEQAKAMEKEQTGENMAKAITFGWELSQHHRLNTEEKLLQMQKDFITSVIKGGDEIIAIGKV